jgi:hypothetical protein
VSGAAELVLAAAANQHLPGLDHALARLPVTIGNEDKIAVIIANENYENGLPQHINGIRDGDAVHEPCQSPRLQGNRTSST